MLTRGVSINTVDLQYFRTTDTRKIKELSHSTVSKEGALSLSGGGAGENGSLSSLVVSRSRRVHVSRVAVRWVSLCRRGRVRGYECARLCVSKSARVTLKSLDSDTILSFFQ